MFYSILILRIKNGNWVAFQNRLEPERNYLTSITGLTPITEISVEETQTSTDPNDQAFVDNNRINNNKTEQRQSK